ncbi:MAG: polysaccharide deacetylase family protein [Clostridia bacterium]|nr:polysaccharide deacetylase family protein [Clostridia bacterium]
MKKTFLRAVSAILCVAISAATLISVNAAENVAGDINRDGEVNNKDVVALFRHLSGDKTEVDERACDTNGDGEVDNKDVVALFRYVSDPAYEISYGTEENPDTDTAETEELTEEQTTDTTETEQISETEETADADSTDEDTTEAESETVTETEEVSEEESVTEESSDTESETAEPPVVYDNVFTEWDDSVINTFSSLKQTDLQLKNNGIALKYTGTGSSADPRFTLDVAEYARIKNKRSLTGADANYIVLKLKSTTDGDFQLYGKKTTDGSKTVSYIPNGDDLRYILFDMTSTKVVKDEKLSTLRFDWGCSKTKTGAEATITEIGFFETLDKALEYTDSIAGTHSGIVRDGTPKKYVTMSFDDATQQDLKVIEILKKYGIDKATFFINTGLCGADWTAYVGVSHVRFTMDELKTGIYNGYDLESHTLNHPSMKQYDSDPASVKRECMQDALNIFNLTGIYPAGMAWPGGTGDQTQTTRKLVYENTNLRFARGTVFQNSLKARYKLPKEFLLWEPTNTMSDSSVLSLFQNYLKRECTEDMLFYGFSHGFEFDAHDTWGVFEQFIQMLSEAVKDGKVVLVTNAEFYQLFKDEIPAYIPAE